MVRIVNTQKVWNLIRWITLTVSGLAIFLFINLLTGEDGFYKNMNISNCLQYPKSIVNACIEDVLETIEFRNTLYRYSLLFGVGLPIVVFGGKWLINYLVPDKKR